MGALAFLTSALALASPVLYVETFCAPAGKLEPYESILAVEYRRPESRTLMTYPEWHIVHAYEEYAQVLEQHAPHKFDFLGSVAGFWSSLCSLTRMAASHGPIDGSTKQMVYVIGASFTVEMLLKATYEETVGRLAVLLRGNEAAPTDVLAASHAKEYATLLQQVPWYKWRFREAGAELAAITPSGLRDFERRFALGLEYGAKAIYAGLIAAAVEATGQDATTLRLVIGPREDLKLPAEIRLVERAATGLIIEAPRYRALTVLLLEMAEVGYEFVEIAGNDDILISVLSRQPTHPGALFSEKRQGFQDYRHLLMIKVPALANTLRQIRSSSGRLEHAYDY